MPDNVRSLKWNKYHIDTVQHAQIEEMHLAKCVGFGQFKRQFVSVCAFEQVLPSI